MMIVRFVTALLIAVAFAVTAFVIDVWWLDAIALAVLVVTILYVVWMVMRYASSDEWLGPEAEAELARDGLVEHESGLPAHPHRRDRQAQPSSPDVPDAWRGPSAAHRVLLVATDPVSPAELRSALPETPDGEDLAVLVIAPALSHPSRLRALLEPDEAVDHATAVSDATVDALHDAGIPTTGHVGPTDPAVAIAHGLRTYDAESVVVARHHRKPLRRREGVDLDGTAKAYGVPLREISIDERPAVPV